MVDEISVGLQQLREAEAMAIEGAAQYLAGRDQIAIALHKISTQKLYLEEKDEKGLPVYRTFDEYWPSIKQKMGGISRSNAFNLKGLALIATGPNFNLSYQEFVELGGTVAFEAVKDVAEINQKTGEIIGLKDGYQVPEGQSVSKFIIEHLKEYSPGNVEELNLNITEHKELLKSKLRTGEEIEIEWFKVKYENSKGVYYKTKWEKRLVNGNEIIGNWEGYIDDVNVPSDVLELYEKRLPIIGQYEGK